MKYCRVLLALGLIGAFAAAAPAGVFFGKQAKPSPAQRVPQLLSIVRTDSDENKRVSAAKELREFDAAAFPEMVPVLIDVLKRDKSAAVRVEAVQTLAKLRPISQAAGLALEQAESDPSWRVRWQARQSLLGYRISGYRSLPKPEEASPAAAAAGKQGTTPVPPPAPAKRLAPVPKTGPVLVPNETPPPPLADPAATPPPSPTIPKSVPPAVPAKAPTAQKPPPPSEDGPDLPLDN